MENNLKNRIQSESSRRKAGRPTLAELAAREAPTTPEVVDIPNQTPGLPPIKGFTCKCCGRGMNPRIYQTIDMVRYVSCELCAGRMKMTYDKSATIVTSIQRI